MQALQDLISTFSAADSRSSDISLTSLRSAGLDITKHGRSRSDRFSNANSTRVFDWAQKSLRAPQNQRVRVNQFEIDEHYQGLIEKFFVLNREDIAVALEERTQTLGSRSHDGFVPEVLSLLLELSDEPLTRTDLQGLQRSRSHLQIEPTALTWEEIIRDEPLSDNDLWREEDYSVSSDEESFSEPEPTTPDKSRSRSGREAAVPATTILDLLLPVEDSELADVELSFDDRNLVTSRDGDLVSEASLVREVMSMLRGSPSSMFATREDSYIHLSSRSDNVKTVTLTNASIVELLQSFASLGSALRALRTWMQSEQDTPVFQSLQTAIFRVVNSLDKSLAAFEESSLSPRKDNNNLHGLISLDAHLQSKSRIVEAVAAMLKDEAARSNQIRCLDSIYDNLCIADSAMVGHVFDPLLSIWSDMFDAWLRPLSQWMTCGTLDDDANSDCMVSQDAGNPGGSTRGAALSYNLRRDVDDSLRAPSLITEMMAQRILDAGKTVQIMNLVAPDSTSDHRAPICWKDIATVREDAAGLSMLPVEQRLSAQLEIWISRHSSQSFEALRDHLWTRCQLGRHLDALELLYFSRDGSLFDAMAQGYFKQIDKARERTRSSKALTWNSLSLTETAREAFADRLEIDGSRIIVKVAKDLSTPANLQGSRSDDLDRLRLIYQIPWPTSLVISSLEPYQKFQTLLLQVVRAKQLMTESKISIRSFSNVRKLTLRLHQKMMWFVDLFKSYLLEMVAAPSAVQLRTRLRAAVGLDAMVAHCNHFAEHITAGAFLSKNARPLHEALQEILELVSEYHEMRVARYAGTDYGDYNKANGRAQESRKSRADQSDDDSEEAREDDKDDDSEVRTAGRENKASTPSADSRALELRFDRLLKFLLAGLKGITCTDGKLHHAYEMFAERLQWGIAPA